MKLIASSEFIPDNHDPIVYYLPSPDGERVKIGTTRNIGWRLASLRRAGMNLNADLLVIEPGDEDLEESRREQFDAYCQSDGWFLVGGDLASHVLSLRLNPEPTS